MKTKSMIAFGILFVLALVGFSSALSVNGPDSAAFENGGATSGILEFSVSGGNATLTLPGPTTITDSSGNVIDVTFSAVSSITNTDFMEVGISVSGTEFDFGEIGSVTADFVFENSTNASDNATESVVITYSNDDYCEGCSNEGELRIDIEDINVINGYGDDDDYWYLMDEVEIELNIENDGDWDVDDVEIDWALYSEDGEELMDGNEGSFNIKDGDKETITFTITLDDNIEDFTGDVTLYVRAKGQIDDNDAGSNDGEDTCDSESRSVTMNIDSDFVIASEFMVNNKNLGEGRFAEGPYECGEEITIRGKLYNIGDADQDNLYLEIYSSALDIYKKIEVDELDAFDEETFEYKFMIPKGIDEKYYEIQFEVYDDNNDIYENSEDDVSRTSVFLNVEGSCVVAKPIFVSSELVDDQAKAGKEMVVSLTLSNPSDESMTLYLSSEGHDTWAKFVGAEPAIVVIGAGEEAKMNFKYEVMEDVSGEKVFSVVAKNVDNEEVFNKQVLVEVKEAGFFDFGDINWNMILIIGINALLLIAIIFVLVRIFRRK